ncbi:MAG: hypothetical protein K940chlam2_00651 [Chlamydiae bacterium]|nr:hypothetical protein [Chlamydiota bacterium]
MKKYPLSIRILLYFQKKRYGAPLGPTLAWGLRPNLLFAFLKLGKAFEKKSTLSSHLRTLVMLKISELNECPFCIDLNTYRLRQENGSPSAADECALEYATALFEKREADDALLEKLKSHFSEAAIVELTALIGFQYLSSLFNRALRIPAQGICKIKN